MEPSSIRIVPSLAAAFLIILYVVLPSSEAAISCSDVIMDMQPCINYLISGIGSHRPLAVQANINLKPELAKSLPENCGISLPFAVSPDVDCSE
ncbi:non-specific lipid-transfer protein 8-like [Primulina eburnea]|uniref:non-specific lipid-transfer protein 8-like n=1 Tax=Primulina eburnea TaxID=1245227 RepID=UPI003C6C6E04